MRKEVKTGKQSAGEFDYAAVEINQDGKGLEKCISGFIEEVT